MKTGLFGTILLTTLSAINTGGLTPKKINNNSNTSWYGAYNGYTHVEAIDNDYTYSPLVSLHVSSDFNGGYQGYESFLITRSSISDVVNDSTYSVLVERKKFSSVNYLYQYTTKGFTPLSELTVYTIPYCYFVNQDFNLKSSNGFTPTLTNSVGEDVAPTTCIYIYCAFASTPESFLIPTGYLLYISNAFYNVSFNMYNTYGVDDDTYFQSACCSFSMNTDDFPNYINLGGDYYNKPAYWFYINFNKFSSYEEDLTNSITHFNYHFNYFVDFTFSLNNENYSSGYSIGYEQGYNNGSNHVSTSFSSLLTSIADTPIIMLKRLFCFDLFGYNLFIVVGSLITLLIFVFVARKVVR